MAQVRQIYISDELNEKLKKEENVSGLISSLLEQYYKFNSSNISEIERTQQEIEKTRREFAEKYSEEYAILEKRKQLIKQDTQSEEQKKQMDKEKRAEMITSILNTFKEEVKREMSPEELSEFLYRFENEKGFNLFKFIDEKK